VSATKQVAVPGSVLTAALTSVVSVGGPNPRLMGNLPGWFLAELAACRTAAKPKRARGPQAAH